MKLVSPRESDAAALAIKFDECRRKNWKMLKLPEPEPVNPAMNVRFTSNKSQELWLGHRNAVESLRDYETQRGLANQQRAPAFIPGRFCGHLQNGGILMEENTDFSELQKLVRHKDMCPTPYSDAAAANQQRALYNNQSALDGKQ